VVHTEGGDASLDAFAGEDFLYLSTTGRITGTHHRIEIWFGLSGQTAYLLSGGGNRSDWVRNLRANPSVRVRIGDREWTGVARVLGPGTDEDALARRLLFEKYGGSGSGDLTTWRDSALPVALDLNERS